jgi:hypothetical protein
VLTGLDPDSKLLYLAAPFVKTTKAQQRLEDVTDPQSVLFALAIENCG